MSKEADQKFVATHKAVWKKIRTRTLKLVAIGLVAIVPLACLLFPEFDPVGAGVLFLIMCGLAWATWYRAAKIAGPNLGKAPGRAGRATLEDCKRVGMVRPR